MQLCDRFPEKVNFVPHSIPPEIFKPLPKNTIMSEKRRILGLDREDHFVGIWVNRNAKRKRPADVLESWKIFLDNLQKEQGHKNATLIMHCDPHDQEGPNLIAISEMLQISQNIMFSNERLDFDQMNTLYNISDFCLNISFAEGFGLSTLESMQAGTPIVAQKTGGLTRQVVDHRDNSENGVGLDVEMRTMVGSQQVPYIYEDYVSAETVSKAIMKMYNLSDKERDQLSEKVMKYVESEFKYQDTIDMWDKTLTSLIENWKENYKRFEIKTL